MKTNLLILLIAASCAMGCKQSNTAVTTEPTDTVKKVELTRVDGSQYVNNFGGYWNYKNASLRFYEEFSTLDTNLTPISKDTFFKKLATGDFIALRISAEKNYYHLFALPDSAKKEYKHEIGYFAKQDYVRFQMEGKPVPKFAFTDIKGNVYTSKNTLGKIVVLKCWFITCHACVAEMPDINKIVDRYANRKDILFISLAIDDKQPLVSFLKTKEFKYQTVSNQKDYMENKLHVVGYPTHIVIDKKGIVQKTVDGVNTLAYVIDAVDRGVKM